MSKKQKILVIEDDLELRGTLTDQLSLYEEYEAIAAENGNKGLQLAKTERIDLVIMDVGLPDIDGREAARILRRTGFKATLPFCRAASTGPYTASPVRDERGGGLYDRPLHISAKLETAPQFQRQQGPLDRKKTSILRHLYRAGQRPVPRRTLLQEVWGYNPEVTTHTLETHIYRLRQKIEKDAIVPSILITEVGGYRLMP
jgi:DNA-binding response OmpR family regulator